MVKSIRWRIQLWHSAVLLLVVECFGSLLYLRLEQVKFDAVDAELASAGHSLLSVLKSLPPPELERPGRLGEEPPPWTEPRPRPPFPPQRLGPRPPGRPPAPRSGPPRESDPVNSERHREQMARFDRSLSLPPALELRYADRPEGRPYFVVWKANGDVLKATPGAPQQPRPDTSQFTELTEEGDLAWRRRGDMREVLLVGPAGSQILLGRSIGAELAELQQWLVLLVASGAVLVALGIAGGTLLSWGSLSSIRTMSATAAGISEKNLAERIDTHGIDRELRELAETLNSAFARLESSFSRQAQFTADASHELRTPLTILLGNLELALSQSGLDAATRESLEASLRAARRMRALIEHLLVLARADAGVLEVERQVFDLGETVEECGELLRPLARQRGVDLHVTAHPAEISGDPRLVAQVVINLVTNAIQYNREGGRVDVTVTARESDVMLIVADTGVGIPAEARVHLFERFYRVDKARSRESGGTGLGLAITKSIVTVHRGAIDVESEEGAGTTIRVRLPRAARQPPAASPALTS